MHGRATARRGARGRESNMDYAVSVGAPGLSSWDDADERIRHSIDVAALCAAYSTCAPTCVLSLSESP